MIKELMYIPILGIYYYLLLTEYNRVGFINNKIKYLLFMYILFLFGVYGPMNYASYMMMILNIIILFAYIPYRTKLSQCLNHIPKNRPMKVFRDRFELNDEIYYFGFDLKEKEIVWLCKRILLRSRLLSKMDIVYLNDEYFGNHFYVNIR